MKNKIVKVIISEFPDDYVVTSNTPIQYPVVVKGNLTGMHCVDIDVVDLKIQGINVDCDVVTLFHSPFGSFDKEVEIEDI